MGELSTLITLTYFDRHGILVDPDRKGKELLARDHSDLLSQLKINLLDILVLHRTESIIIIHSSLEVGWACNKWVGLEVGWACILVWVAKIQRSK